jgi:sensor histidine kinase YesM
VPPLILQPIVENAVRHGISAVSTAGVVDVRAERDNGWLRLTVRDDGPGPHAKVSNPGSGTGIRNTRERLQQLYGAAARFSIDAGPTGGTVVVIDIPLAPPPATG